MHSTAGGSAFPPCRGEAGPSAFLLFCAFVYPFYVFLKFNLFPSTRSGRAGPLLSGQQKVGKDWPRGFAPLDSPWCGRWRPLWPQFAAREPAEPAAAARRRASGETCDGFCPFWGLRPLPPKVPNGGVCRSCAPRMVPRPKRLCGQRPRKSPGSSSSRRSEEFRRPLARLCRRHSSATAGGTCRGEAPQPVFAYFLLARK